MLTFDVAITTFKRPDDVMAAVKSCLIQGTWLRKVVVLDDASGDDTVARLAALNDSRVEVHVRSVNGGTGMARHDVLRLCRADWVVLLDSDWELRPAALERFAALIAMGPADLVMVGSRLQWDTGQATPPVVPLEPLDYRAQIHWRNRRDSLWVDNLAVVARRVLDVVEWPAYRTTGHADTVFFLDVALHGRVRYSPDCLGYEKSNALHGYTRGSRRALLARRTADAASAIAVCELLLKRHGEAMRTHGRTLLAAILLGCSMYALLAGRRLLAWRWLRESIALDHVTHRHCLVALGLVAGRRAFTWLYLNKPGVG